MGGYMNRFGRKLPVLAAAALAPLALASCQKPAEPVDAGTAKVTSAMGILGPHFYSLPTCAQAIDYIKRQTGATDVEFAKPSHVIRIELNDSNPRSIGAKLLKKKVNGAYNDEDMNDAGVAVTSTGKPKPTKLDFDVELGAPDTNGAKVIYKTALVKVVLKPNIGQSFHFVAPDYAVRAGDDNGLRMFCDVHVDAKADTATFTSYYFKEENKDYGTFNFGVVVDDDDNAHQMTIFYDPEVKNDG
jgi:hypothetical protein